MTRGKDTAMRCRSEEVQAVAQARARKALKLADTFQAAQADSAFVAAASEQDWSFAEAVAGVRPASPETRELVVEVLRMRERRNDDDPFEGL